MIYSNINYKVYYVIKIWKNIYYDYQGYNLYNDLIIININIL